MFSCPAWPSRSLVPIVVAVLSSVAIAQSPKATFYGRVVGVTDGDTIKVLREVGGTRSEVKVRLDGIDAPESTQPFGSKSKRFASDMVFGRTVTVEVTDTDRYGRSVGRVHVGGVNGPSLNLASVRAGMAWWYRHYAPNDAHLRQAEDEARAARRGLWSEPNALAPWDYRHGRGKSANAVAAPSKGATRRSVPAPAVVSRAEVSVTVYVTDTGSKYHSVGCRYLRSSSIPMKRSDAIKRYESCSVCGA